MCEGSISRSRWGITVAHQFSSALSLLASIALSLGVARAQTTPQPPDTMAARVLACASCHGAEGEGTSDVYFPRLAGKPAGYLYNQLVAFRDGRRQYPPMNYLVAYLPDAYLREMANYYAKLRPPFEARDPRPADVAMLERGKSIATAGDPRVGIPPCIACHGSKLTGMEPGIPGLVGLRAPSLAATPPPWRGASRSA